MSDDNKHKGSFMFACIAGLLIGAMALLLLGAALFGRNGHYASAWEQLDHE